MNIIYLFNVSYIVDLADVRIIIIVRK